MSNIKGFTGEVVGFKKNKAFYMVVVENSYGSPKIKYQNYQDALIECMRLSKKEGKSAWVVMAVAEVEQVTKINSLDFGDIS